MEINVDNLISSRKNTEKKTKDIEKLDKKLKIKISKKPVNKMPITEYKQINYFRIPEYIQGLEEVSYKILSLPARERRAILEKKLRNSKEFKELLNSNMVDKLMMLNIPREGQLFLTYAYHYISTMYLDMLENKIESNNNINV